MPKKSKPETTLQARIVKALEDMGRIVIRIQCGKVKVRGGWMQLAPEGTPDLYVVGKGRSRSTWLETKTPFGDLSDVQHLMHNYLLKGGDRVGVVRSVKDALEVCNVPV